MPPPKTLPADFFDKQGASSPQTLPAQFFDQQGGDTPEAIRSRAQTPEELELIMNRIHSQEGPGFRDYLNTLLRELGAIGSIPGGMYHSFSDPDTTEEASRKRKISMAGGNVPDNAISRGLDRMAVQPVVTAADFYRKLLTGKMPDMNILGAQVLDVAPEAIGGAAGSVLLGKAMSSAGNVLGKGKVPMNPESAMTLIRKGVLPKDPEFMSNLSKNLDVLKKAPKVESKAQLADYLNKSGTEYREMYEKLLKPHENTVAGTQARAIKGYKGENLGGEGERVTLRQLDNRLNVINNTIRDAKAGVGGQPLSTEGIAPLKAEAHAIRSTLYSELKKLTGVDPAPIHAKMGQLNELSRQVRESEIARFNQIHRPIDAPTTTKAGVVGRVAGSAQRKVFGDPQDVAIKKALQGLRGQ